MESIILNIGAPSLNDGANPHKEIKDKISHLSFPYLLNFKNLMPRTLAIPQGFGLVLNACGNHDDSVSIMIKKVDELLRIITDIQVIAELNNFASAVTISCEYEPLSSTQIDNKKQNKQQQAQAQTVLSSDIVASIAGDK